MIKYENNGKYAYFDGIKFTRDDKTGYYLNSTIRKRLHRYVWEYFHGEIPKGWHVHHVDGDKNNNHISNLVIIPHGKHATLHGEMNALDERWLEWARNNLAKNARPKANEWHKTEEGKAWHKELWKRSIGKMEKQVYKCEYCAQVFAAKPNTKNRFCSNKCKSAWRRKEGLDNEERVCECCGEHFVTNRFKKTKYCSKKCSNKAVPRLPQLRKN
ncbi:HNH endonuclease signature motif containing protein [Anoxybacillus sp. EFIL]|uniref:HNH endonuclease signature motif containing protein n=1 Tax=Anoxybacillus sp. EFIL TaxID=2508869 RepID=UPI00148C2DF2|nr:HNH endonuclease signature motif containing protein [Anoxybacillus sp. EFIL]NNU96185.1 HNH endonuclease [Anoxybacillus sp. EFIL]